MQRDRHSRLADRGAAGAAAHSSDEPRVPLRRHHGQRRCHHLWLERRKDSRLHAGDGLAVVRGQRRPHGWRLRPHRHA
eukprot:7128818-Prorocentrum_lima.AAC.1